VWQSTVHAGFTLPSVTVTQTNIFGEGRSSGEALLALGGGLRFDPLGRLPWLWLSVVPLPSRSSQAERSSELL